MKPIIQTFSGAKLNPIDPDPESIHISDIAHALSNLCRFTGHCRHFYSVAEHSCLVAEQLPPEYALIGLLHDASEAYISDISRPVKPYLSNYKDIEYNLQGAIYRKFGLHEEPPIEVKAVDERMCFTEGLHLMHDCSWWEMQREPYELIIECLSPLMAKSKFLDMFIELISKRAAGG